MMREKAERFWRGVAEGVANNERILLVAQNERGEIVGAVQGCSRGPRISRIALIFRRWLYIAVRASGPVLRCRSRRRRPGTSKGLQEHRSPQGAAGSAGVQVAPLACLEALWQGASPVALQSHTYVLNRRRNR